MPSIDKLRHNIRHAVSLSAFSPNLIHRIRYFFSLYSYFPRLLWNCKVTVMFGYMADSLSWICFKQSFIISGVRTEAFGW